MKIRHSLRWAAAAFWGDLATNIDNALGKIEQKVAGTTP
jgi:hypothetical protein